MARPRKIRVGLEPVVVDASTDRPVRITPDGQGLHFTGEMGHTEALLHPVTVAWPSTVTSSKPGRGQFVHVGAA